MDYSEKKEFLEHAQDLARNLEEKTNKFIEIQIGWIKDNTHIDTLPVTIMLNHDSAWFGTFEKIGWNTQVLFNNLNYFIPVENPYLILNKLIDKAIE